MPKTSARPATLPAPPSAAGAAQPQLSDTDRARLVRTVQVPGATGLIGLIVVVVLVVWSIAGSGFNLERFVSGIPRMADFLVRMWPASFDKFPIIVELLTETLQMAVVGTLIGAALSLLVSFGATSTIAPKWLYNSTRFVLNVLRSIPELIFALMFVSAVGLGPFAGILALIIGSIGSIGKVYAEAMESVSTGPIEALSSAGASKRQVITYGVVPQAAPLLVSYTLLLFEGNVRGATILGLVGAGGIGMELTTAMRMYDYGHLFAIIISIIVLVTVIDRISALIRKKIT